MTPEQFRALVEFQAGRCAVCLRVLPIDKVSESRRGRSPIHVDHDHVSGEIRGILCYACNQGLGLYEDVPDRLRRAAAYLESPPARLAFGVGDGEQLTFPQLRVVSGVGGPVGEMRSVCPCDPRQVLQMATIVGGATPGR